METLHASSRAGILIFVASDNSPTLLPPRGRRPAMAKPAGRLSALTSAQRVRLWRRWFSLTARARMRAFAPLLVLLALLAALVLLPGAGGPLLASHDRLLMQEVDNSTPRRSLRPCWNVSALTEAGTPLLKVPRACEAMWFTNPAETAGIPKAAVVIALPAGVPPAAALATATSVVERSPRRLLAEVIIAVAPGSLALSDARSLNRLRRARTLRVRDAPPPSPGASPWDESAFLRSAAAASASAPAVVFLSPGSLPGHGWLPALLGELSEDAEKGRRASVVAFAVGGVLDARTWTLPADSRRLSGPLGHDWALNPLRFYRERDPTSPLRLQSPLLPGDDFAVSRGFLSAVGGIGTDGRTGFGLRVWSCGGAVSEMPCAPLGRAPVCGIPASDDTRRRRVAREMLGAFAPFAAIALGGRIGPTWPKSVSPKKGCDGFRFYVRTGFPELQPSAEILLGGGQGPHAWGRLRSLLGGCVAAVKGGDVAEGMRVGACDRAPVAILTERGSITVGRELTAACATSGKLDKDKEKGMVTLERCNVPQKEPQMWEIEPGRRTRVFAGKREGGRCLTVETGGVVVVRKCEKRAARAQMWTWENRVEFPDGDGADVDAKENGAKAPQGETK